MAFESLVHAIQAFIHSYGLLAVFVYLALETGMILHFAPSELVVPFAAAELVHGPVSFVVFNLVATAGAALGALFPYLIFARYGRVALERYGRFVHIDTEDVDKGEAWFRKWGESSTLWGRVLPFVRAYISIPAGLAEMDVRKYAIYSTIGAGAYNTLITYLVYTGEDASSPLHVLWDRAASEVLVEVTYLHAHLFLAAALGVVLLGVASWLWYHREAVRANPVQSLDFALLVLAGLGVIAGTSLVAGALLAPDAAYAFVTDAWNDPTFFVSYGSSRRLALALSGSGVLVGGGVLYAVHRLLPIIEATHALVRRLLVLRSV